MRGAPIALSLIPLLMACDGVLNVAGVCVASVLLNDIWYQESSETVAAPLVSPAVFGTARRQVTCNDTSPLSPGAITEYEDGDVLGFPVGTTFHEIASWEASVRLAVQREDTWVMMVAVAQ